MRSHSIPRCKTVLDVATIIPISSAQLRLFLNGIENRTKKLQNMPGNRQKERIIEARIASRERVERL